MGKHKVSFDEFCWKVVVYTISIYLLTYLGTSTYSNVGERFIVAILVGIGLAAFTTTMWNAIVDICRWWSDGQ